MMIEKGLNTNVPKRSPSVVNKSIRNNLKVVILKCILTMRSFVWKKGVIKYPGAVRQCRRHTISHMDSCNNLKLLIETNQSLETMPAGIALLDVRKFVELPTQMKFRLVNLKKR